MFFLKFNMYRYTSAIPNLMPSEVQLGFNRLIPPDQIALLATADTVVGLYKLLNSVDPLTRKRLVW